MFGLLAIGGWSLVIAAAVATFVSMVVGAASGATRKFAKRRVIAPTTILVAVVLGAVFVTGAGGAYGGGAVE